MGSEKVRPYQKKTKSQAGYYNHPIYRYNHPIVNWWLYHYNYNHSIIEGSLEVKLPTIWTVEKQR